jgi:hypothetical protein
MLKFDDRKILILSIVATVVVLFGGLYNLLTQWNYYEDGQDIIAVLYAVGCVGLFFAFRFMNPARIILIILILSMIQFYAQQKFDWRAAYIDSSKTESGFVLDQYIKEYPTYEQHVFGAFWGAPKYVDFAEECIEPTLRGVNAQRECKSSNAISNEYNINAKEMVDEHFQKMKRTAQRIEGGQMKSKRQYEACLVNKTCAIIPLLPANVDADSISRQSEDHIATRRMFWSLVNGNQITPELCEFMDLCRALRDLDVIPIEEPEIQ